MHASGQNQVDGHSITVRNAAGAVVATATMTDDVPNGQNNRKILLGDTSAFGGFDFPANIGTLVAPAGGAVCFEDIDCVAWGTFSGSLPSPSATVPGPLSLDNSLTRRLDVAGCPTFLEAADDTNGAGDFLLTAVETPTRNTAPVVGACPDTRFTKTPRKRTTRRRAKFKFEATPAAPSFECKLDDRPFRPCDVAVLEARQARQAQVQGAGRGRGEARDATLEGRRGGSGRLAARPGLEHPAQVVRAVGRVELERPPHAGERRPSGHRAGRVRVEQRPGRSPRRRRIER